MGSWRERPVAGIGIVGLDHVVVTDRWERDAKTTASHYFEQAGGPVPVALCAMARLGLAEPPRFYGVVGEDETANTIRRWLTEAGVDASPIRPARGESTGHSLVVLDTSDGTRTLTNLPGPAMDSSHTLPLWMDRARTAPGRSRTPAYRRTQSTGLHHCSASRTVKRWHNILRLRAYPRRQSSIQQIL